jgi:quinol-cytochrome oxidoreductase complex cytochrome b subunit
LILTLVYASFCDSGEGDLHAAQFSGYRETIALTTPGMFSDKSPTYTLTVYPTDEFFEVYSTLNPTITTVGSVCIIVFTSLLFLMYDFLVRQESHHKLLIQEAKRQFIRFVRYVDFARLSSSNRAVLIVRGND